MYLHKHAKHSNLLENRMKAVETSICPAERLTQQVIKDIRRLYTASYIL